MYTYNIEDYKWVKFKEKWCAMILSLNLYVLGSLFFRESTSSVQTNAVYGSFTSPIVALCNENFGECLNAWALKDLA